MLNIRSSYKEISQNQTLILETLIEISKSNPYYSKTILKTIINELESREEEIEEEYYEYLIQWLSSSEPKPTDMDNISYPLGKNRFTNIRESRNLISGLGTTGLRTWEASLFVTDYILNQIPQDLFDYLFKDKNVLELGCGTGFIGISIIKHMKEQINKMYMTDGDSQLIDNIDTNLHLNSIDKNDSKLEVCKLWWGEDEIPEGVSTLIAADVTYDASIIPSLIKIVKDSMGSTGGVHDLLLGATVRNEETLNVWEKALVSNEDIWKWSVITERPSGDPRAGESLWFGFGTAPIKLYHVTKIC